MQHEAVWILPPQGESEGPTFITRTAPITRRSDHLPTHRPPFTVRDPPHHKGAQLAARVPQLRRRRVTRNPPLSRADAVITGSVPRHQAHRDFSATRPR